jgi:Tol biopolymer transport system component
MLCVRLAPTGRTEGIAVGIRAGVQVLGFSTERKSLARLVTVLCVGVAFLATATPAHATFPGANGKLLFTRGTGTGNFTKLSTMNPDGGGVADVTNANANDSSGAWSPDGTKIAFASNRDDPAQFNDKVYVVNADGTGITRLTNSTGRDSSPAWSPDGTKIAFVRYPGTGISEYIYVVNADGTNEHQLADLRGAFGLASASDLEWSPDGTTIAFDDQIDIYAMTADGTSVAKLTNNRCCDEGASNPTWSPDSQKLAFTQDSLTGDVGTGDVVVINPDGTGKVDITEGFFDDEIVRAWSPDGTRIWFVEDVFPSGDYTDAFMNPDGTNVATIPVLTNGTDWQPLPSPQRRPGGDRAHNHRHRHPGHGRRGSRP